MSIAERMFDGHLAQGQLESDLWDAGAKFDNISFDDYDCSIELYEVPAEHRLSEAVQRLIHAAGFRKAYVNHVNKWQTHYGFKPDNEFTFTDGWRVSYPHDRGPGEKGILVEKSVDSWPKEWFETGYALVQPPSAEEHS